MEFQEKRDRAKFCSAKCKMKFHRQNPKKDTITQMHLLNLYNRFLEAIEEFKNTKDYVQKPVIPKKETEIIPATVYPEVSLFEKYEQKINNAETAEELDNIGRLIQMDKNLVFFQKKQLFAIGMEKSKRDFFD